MTAKIKQAKKCRVCGKVLREWNKSGFCSHHYRINLFKNLRKKRKASHLCIRCEKKVEPIIIYPAGNTLPPITKYPIRCYTCRQKDKDYYIKMKKIKNAQNNQNTQDVINKVDYVTTQ